MVKSFAGFFNTTIVGRKKLKIRRSFSVLNFLSKSYFLSEIHSGLHPLYHFRLRGN